MLEIGRIAKAHGLRGEVIVELFTNREERLAPGSVLVSNGDTLVVRRATPHQHRWIVAFAGVDTREDAEQLHGLVLHAEPIDDPEALWVHELVGSEVLDNDGERIGTVASILANPAGDIIETDNGVLIPLRFVVETGVVETGPDFVRVDPPPGLLEVNE